MVCFVKCSLCTCCGKLACLCQSEPRQQISLLSFLCFLLLSDPQCISFHMVQESGCGRLVGPNVVFGKSSDYFFRANLERPSRAMFHPRTKAHTHSSDCRCRWRASRIRGRKLSAARLTQNNQRITALRSPIAVLHHEVYCRWRVHHLVERDDVRVPHSLEYFYLAADPLYIGYALDAALLQNLDTARSERQYRLCMPQALESRCRECDLG